jgi:hypothetical protein
VTRKQNTGDRIQESGEKKRTKQGFHTAHAETTEIIEKKREKPEARKQ